MKLELSPDFIRKITPFIEDYENGNIYALDRMTDAWDEMYGVSDITSDEMLEALIEHDLLERPSNGGVMWQPEGGVGFYHRYKFGERRMKKLISDLLDSD